MFEHSVPVPRLYRFAAKITEAASKNEESVKNLVYKTNHRNTKAIYALVVEILKYNKQLDFLLKQSKLFEKEPRFNPWLAKVLVTELLWGKKRLPGQSKPIKTILTYQQVLSAHAYDVHENDSTINKVNRPRFVRINTILTSINDVIDAFRDKGWTLVRHMDTKDYEGFLDKVRNLVAKQFMVDIHIPELLIFPPNTEFHAHNAYISGRIVLQDKASCLPSLLLSPEPGSIVLDMCAAPGMKTSHLAAKLNNNGKIYAVDIDTKRLKALEEFMHKSGITCVETINKDVLKITNDDCKDVEYILVDPSCSGSGMVDRLDLLEPTVKNDERIQKLRGFQIMILKHALRRFPKAKKVIYSTCSLYPEENEEVVKEVVSQTTHYKLVNAAELLKRPWLNFGSEKYGEIGKFCLYCKPDTEMSNGFFVAVFQRLEDGEENEFYVPNPTFQNTKESKSNTRNKKENEYTNTSNAEKICVKQNDRNKDKKNETKVTKVVLRKSKRRKKKCKKRISDKNSDKQHGDVQSINNLQDHLNEEDKIKKKRKSENEIQNNCEDRQLEIDTGDTKKRKTNNISEYDEESTNEQALTQYQHHDLKENEIKTKKKKKHKHNIDDNKTDDEVCDTEINETPSKKKKRNHEKEVVANFEETQSPEENRTKKKKEHKHNCDNDETDENYNSNSHPIETNNIDLISNNKDDKQEKINSATSNSESNIKEAPSKKKKKNKETRNSNNSEETEFIVSNSVLSLKKKHKREKPDEEKANYNTDLDEPKHMSVEDLLESYIKKRHSGSNASYDSSKSVKSGDVQDNENKHKHNCDSNETDENYNSNSHPIETNNFDVVSSNKVDKQEKLNSATFNSENNIEETPSKKKKQKKETRGSNNSEGTEFVANDSELSLKKKHKKEKLDEEKANYNMDLGESKRMSVEDLLESYIKKRHSGTNPSYDSSKGVKGEDVQDNEKKHKHNCDSNEKDENFSNSNGHPIETDNFNLVSNNKDDKQEKLNSATSNSESNIQETPSKKKKKKKETRDSNNSEETEFVASDSELSLKKKHKNEKSDEESTDYSMDLFEPKLMSVEDLLENYIKQRHCRSNTSYDSSKDVKDEGVKENEDIKRTKSKKHSLDADETNNKKNTTYTQNICGFLK